MVEIVCVIIACISFGVAIFSQITVYKQRKYIEQAVEDINHFLIYPEEIKDEFLEEGYFYNLMNQIIKLETQIIYDRNAFQKKETQVNCFIENMAHQMKTSITAIQIRLDYALDICQDSKEKDSLIKSQECLLRLTNEVERLLTASQLAAGKVLMVHEKFNMNEMIFACVNRLNILAEKRNVALNVDGKVDATYCGDEFWLTQAVENVIKNAVEHTKEFTNVQICVFLQNSCIKIRVEDEGDGIPEEEIGNLFERFCRGSSRKKGYGIGLSMAKDIIQSHHGTISAGNRETGGAWFLISLPILDGAEVYKDVSGAESKM